MLEYNPIHFQKMVCVGLKNTLHSWHGKKEEDLSHVICLLKQHRNEMIHNSMFLGLNFSDEYASMTELHDALSKLIHYVYQLTYLRDCILLYFSPLDDVFAMISSLINNKTGIILEKVCTNRVFLIDFFNLLNKLLSNQQPSSGDEILKHEGKIKSMFKFLQEVVQRIKFSSCMTVAGKCDYLRLLINSGMLMSLTKGLVCSPSECGGDLSVLKYRWGITMEILYHMVNLPINLTYLIRGFILGQLSSQSKPTLLMQLCQGISLVIAPSFSSVSFGGDSAEHMDLVLLEQMILLLRFIVGMQELMVPERLLQTPSPKLIKHFLIDCIEILVEPLSRASGSGRGGSLSLRSRRSLSVDSSASSHTTSLRSAYSSSRLAASLSVGTVHSSVVNESEGGGGGGGVEELKPIRATLVGSSSDYLTAARVNAMSKQLNELLRTPTATSNFIFN